jgi:two-component system, cell cycle sensor histidine kinase and response regulator CckA
VSLSQWKDQFAGKMVLLAEDEPLVRNCVRHILQVLGFSVLAATDGAEALRISQSYQGKIDLLLTDVVMPGLHGIELANHLRSERPEIRVLIMSGRTSGQLEELTRRADFLRKPFLPDMLAQKLEEVFASGQPNIQEF